MNLAIATTINSVSLTWNSKPIQYVSSKNIMPSILTFEFETEKEINQIIIDASELNPENSDYKTITTSISKCGKQGNKYTCAIQGIMLKPITANPTIHFTFKNSTSSETIDQQVSFTIDNTNPEVTFIGTKNCEENKCYVGSGVRNKIIIEMQDQTASFSRGLVFFTLGTSYASMVSNCEGLKCYGYSSVKCTDGQQVMISISNHPMLGRSRDDANNPLTGKLTNNLMCDEKSPEVDETTITYKSGSGLPTRPAAEEYADETPVIGIGDDIIITFNATDPTTPKMNVTANLTSIGQQQTAGNCEKTNDYSPSNPKWQCNIRFKVTPSEPGIINIPITVKDFVGHESTFKAEFKANVQDESNQHYWKLRKVARFDVNKHYLEFSPRKLFTTITLQGNPSNRILKVEPKNGCEPIKDRNGNIIGHQGDIIDFTINKIGGKSLLASMTLTPGEKYGSYGERVSYNCSFQVWTKAGDYVTSKPEELSFIVTINFHDSRTIGEAIKEEVGDAMNTTLKQAQKIGEIRRTVESIRRYCSILPMLKNSGAVLTTSAAGLTFAGMPQYAKPIGTTGEKISQSADHLNDIIGVCSFLSCNQKINNYFKTKLDNTFLSDATRAIGVGNFSQTFNPYDSLATAVMTMCVPAIIKHVEDYQAINCERIRCLTEDVQAGVPPEQCDKQAQYALCTYKWGQFAGMPLIGNFRNLLRDAVNVFRDPVSFFSTTIIAAGCKAGSLYLGTRFLCDAEQSLRGAIESIATVRQIGNQFNTIMGHEQVPKSACDQLREGVDPTTYYWNYAENKAPVFAQKKTITIGGKQREMVCSQFNGCTITGNNGIKITLMPTNNENNPYELFINGRAAAKETYNLINDEQFRSFEKEEIKNKIKNNNKEWSDISLLKNGGFLKQESPDSKSVTFKPLPGLSQIGPELQAFHNSMQKKISQEYGFDSQFMKAYNNYVEKVTNYYNDYEKKVNNEEAKRQRYEALKQYYDAAKFYAEKHNSLKLKALKLTPLFPKLAGNPDRLIGKVMTTNPSELSNLAKKQHWTDASYDENYFKNLQKNLQELQENKEMIKAAEKYLSDNDLKIDLGSPDIKKLKQNKNKLKEEIKKAEEEAKKAKKEREKLEKDLKKAQEEFKSALNYEQNWAGLRMIGSVLRWGRAVRTFSPQLSDLIWEGSAEHWTRVVDRFAERHFGDIGLMATGNWENYKCRDNLGTGDNSIVLSQVATTTFKSMAHVEALRIPQGWEGNNYTYQINAYVKNNNPFDFKVQVLLEGDGTLKVLDKELKSGGSLERTKSNFIKINATTKKYNNVCLKFSRELSEIFDITNAPFNNKICRRIETK